VLAILVGVLIRTLWKLPPVWSPGIDFSAKTLLEISVAVLGVSVSAKTLLTIDVAVIGGIAAVVIVSILASYGISRLVGLPKRMALLVACGNAICGNSAIVAVAPVIGADADEVAASIAFTAVLGVAVVLGLPLLISVFGLSKTQYGFLAGLTVYAVPQVLAATMPVGQVALHIGTLVKLVRVLMLGPVVLVISLFTNILGEESDEVPHQVTAVEPPTRRRPAAHRMVPWFIIGFVALSAARSAGLIPRAALGPLAIATGCLTTMSMAALGLAVQVQAVVVAGPRLTIAVTGSLLLIGAVAVVMIRVLGIE
jgi:uncharacterized integral membrane protein (TIGR00698 family)